ncbi:MAG: ATP-binding protein, partial [Albidovulum sp.]
AKSAVDVTLDLGATRPVAMNQTELQQVLINLMVNAIQAMPDGGQLHLLTTLKEDVVVIEVRDTGSGMPPEVQARVFDPFFTTKRSAGTGLGLSISRDLITRASGRIEVMSAPGKGTMFRIFLPVVPQV